MEPLSRGSARYPVTVWVSFVRGTPLKYTDPSGHRVAECEDFKCVHSKQTPNLARFDGSWNDYDDKEQLNKLKLLFRNTTLLIAARITQALNRGISMLCKMGEIDSCERLSQEEAFTLTFGGPLTVTYDPKISSAAQANGTKGVKVRNVGWLLGHPRLAIHEMGHVFLNRFEQEDHVKPPADYLNSDPILRRTAGNYGQFPDYNGFAGGQWDWQFSLSSQLGFPVELFADMFLGWVYIQWGPEPLGPYRANAMNMMMMDLLYSFIP